MNGTRGLLIATAAAFIVGCSVGLMGGILFMRFAVPGSHQRFERRVGPPASMMRRGPGSPGHPERMMPFLERELALTPEQISRMELLLDKSRREHEAVNDSLKARLPRELTPRQQTRWKEVEERTLHSMRERRGRDRR